MLKVLLRILGLIFVFAGIGISLYPTAVDWKLDQQTARYIKEFDHNYNEEYTNENKEEDPLYQEILAYNQSIFKKNQSEFKDAWSYIDVPVSISSLKSEIYGIVEIPSMNVTLPLYLGASDRNMERGAAVLGQTSIPIGGVNTNSVIAGHRGWRTGSFFREIEKIAVGDQIYITNPWETLVYRAEAIDIISPYDSDKVMIQEGKDMVTLITCHPYLSHGRYRYVVYCVRDGKEKPAASGNNYNNGYIVASDGSVYESSEELIRKEDTMRTRCALVMIIVVMLSILYAGFKNRRVIKSR